MLDECDGKIAHLAEVYAQWWAMAQATEEEVESKGFMANCAILSKLAEEVAEEAWYEFQANVAKDLAGLRRYDVPVPKNYTRTRRR